MLIEFRLGYGSARGRASAWGEPRGRWIIG
jgi:hypothetical protein